jgi:diketogulonate reductase-like aldo/keto reductase
MSELNVKTATLQLHNGVHIPQIGLGVWQVPRGETTREAVRIALARGYRHIDTARVYGNEVDVGAGVRESGLPRAEVFITTKLWNDDQGYDQTLRAFDTSLKRLGVEYLDLYLLHWPVPEKRLDSWEALERLYAEKRVRAIGVSNFLVPHLRELLAGCEVAPHVNQIELTPFLQRRETRALCQEHQIVIEAYSPLTRGQKLHDPTVTALAQRLGCTPAQVLLRWGIQQGVVVLPKSATPARIAENAAVFAFELDESAMRALDQLEENLVTGWDPAGQR